MQGWRGGEEENGWREGEEEGLRTIRSAEVRVEGREDRGREGYEEGDRHNWE